jgi:hypothetical protein
MVAETETVAETVAELAVVALKVLREEMPLEELAEE